jgi:selenoprotein W-related protein
MAGSILSEFEHHIGDVTLIPSRGGVFEVVAGDELIYSKKATQRHADYEADVAPTLRKLLGGGQ